MSTNNVVLSYLPITVDDDQLLFKLMVRNIWLIFFLNYNPKKKKKTLKEHPVKAGQAIPFPLHYY